MESKNSRLYLKVVFILSGDVNCNPGSVTRNQINDPKFEAFNSRRLHFTHVNIDMSSALNKDELCNIVEYSGDVVIGITELN